jgi:predicted aconitase
MFLTEEEAEMLAGQKGPAVKKAMEILVALGEGFGANFKFNYKNYSRYE